VSVCGLVLAAGAGSRFGGDVPKPLAPFRGRPLLTWPLAALRAGGVQDIILVTGAHSDAIHAAASGERVVHCADWAEGLSASLRAGVAAAAGAGADAILIALADQPLLSGEAIARVIAAREPDRFDAIRATYSGTPNHPTLLESSLFTAVAELRGDTGARPLLREAKLVPCDGLGSPEDADTPETLARLEAQAPRGSAKRTSEGG
jgi:CTP:molybdopterin cytidylyltransferase MocA